VRCLLRFQGGQALVAPLSRSSISKATVLFIALVFLLVWIEVEFVFVGYWYVCAGLQVRVIL
jgi:hypothetical protein